MAHNIAIKRYCDKIILSHTQGILHYFLSLPWLGIKTYRSKISFYCNIFYLFIAILCTKMSHVNKALSLSACNVGKNTLSIKRPSLNGKNYSLAGTKVKFCKIGLGLIHTRHFGAQYCDKTIFLSHGFQ